MKFASLGQLLTDVRLGLENKIINNELIKVKLSSELEFLQQITVLIPAEFLYSINLYYPPWMILRVWCSGLNPSTYLYQRYTDIDQMIIRILSWYEQKLPPRTETNGVDIDLLLEIKEFFVNLKIKNDELLNQNSNNPAPQHICNGGSCWDTCWETLFYCYFYLFLLHFPKKQPVDTKFQLSDKYEGPYGTGGARKFYCPIGCLDENGKKQCCSRWNCDGCGRCCDDCCWYCARPTYYNTDTSHHHHHHYYYYDHHHHDVCCRECIVSTGLLDACQACCHGMWNIVRLSIEGFGNCCNQTIHFLTSICSSGSHQLPNCNCDCECHNLCNGCGNCDCPIKDECFSAVTAVFGAIGGAIALIIDAISGGNKSDDSNIPTNTTNLAASNSILDHESPLRRLNTQTSSEYTPSIVFMIFALIVFIPRLLPNLCYTLINLYQGISKNHSWKVLTSMFFIGLPLAIILSVFGGASRWTYVSLILMFMHSMYAIYSVQRKKVSPSLIDLSYLSCAEWRAFNYSSDQVYLGHIVDTLVRYQDTFRHESRQLKQKSIIFVWMKIIWPTLDKAYIRWNLREDIRASHQLDTNTLQQRYGTQPIMDSPHFLPVATLVQDGNDNSSSSVGEKVQHQPISQYDRL